MKTILLLLAVVGAGLTLCGLAIVSGDRRTMVPPPDAVAESFARELTERRYELATRYLSSGLRGASGSGSLRAWFEPTRQRLGEPGQVAAEPGWMHGDRAVARAVIEAERGTATLELPMVRQAGLWVVDSLPSEIPVAVQETVGR